MHKLLAVITPGFKVFVVCVAFIFAVGVGTERVKSKVEANTEGRLAHTKQITVIHETQIKVLLELEHMHETLKDIKKLQTNKEIANGTQ